MTTVFYRLAYYVWGDATSQDIHDCPKDVAFMDDMDAARAFNDVYRQENAGRYPSDGMGNKARYLVHLEKVVLGDTKVRQVLNTAYIF